ncbi:MAG: hypothetical protein ABIT69_10215 [Sphingomicrobium sp.]
MGLLLGGTSSLACAQTQPAPPPPNPSTTISEPTPAPDETPPATTPNSERKLPEHVPQDASGIDLSTLETNDFKLLYFDPVQTYLTPYVARALTNSLRFHEEKFHWKQWDRSTILLKDFGDYGNAGARSSPNNAVLLDVAPLSQTMETFSPGERFFTLSNHELAHVATMDVWNNTDAFWRRLFAGKVQPIQEHPESILYNFLVTPRVNAPRWQLEGTAVFFETWMAGGLGRAQGGYDEMVFRAMVRDHAKFYSPLGLESEGTAIDFQVGVNDYLYGTRFVSYLALKYGPDKVLQWLRRDEDSAGYYASQFHRVFGQKLDRSWADWIGFEHEFQAKNLAALSQYPLTEVQHLTPRGLGSVSRTYYDAKTNSLVGAFKYPGVIAYVGTLSLADGKLHHLADLKGSMLYRVTSIAFDPDARTAYYTEDNHAFRDLVALNIDTGKKRRLLTDARIGDLVINPRDKSIWGIRHQNGYATIVRIPAPYAGFNQINTFDYGQIPFDLDISADGSMVSASFGEVDGKQSVRVWRADQFEQGGGPNEIARLDMPPSTPEGFVFAPDGKSLVGTSYYTGVSNVFRFDIASGKYEALTNASTGFFHPMVCPDGSLFVQEFTGEGLTPSIIKPQVREDLGTVSFLGTQVIHAHPELKSWGVGSPAKIDLEPLITARSHYKPGKEMKLAAAFPIVEGYLGRPTFGYYFHFEDPLQFRQLSGSFSASPFGHGRLSDRLHADVEYKTLDWKFRYWHNDADIYDLAGPIKRSRKGDAVIASYNKTKIYDPPRQLDVFGSVAGYFGLEQLPAAQNILSPKNIFSSEFGTRYTNTVKSLGGVDHEKGFAARLIGGLDWADRHAFPHLSGGVDYGIPLPIANSSAWIYAHGGIVGGDRSSPLGAFYFGSFRNNYVDNRPEKRYRELESFPGFDIDQIVSRKFAKVTGEINLPPLRFAEIGTPAFYLSYARPALFAGTMLTQSPGRRNYRLSNIGAQVDLAFTVALRLPMIFSFGIAKGFGDKDIDGNTEFLTSLKIM